MFSMYWTAGKGRQDPPGLSVRHLKLWQTDLNHRKRDHSKHKRIGVLTVFSLCLEILAQLNHRFFNIFDTDTDAQEEYATYLRSHGKTGARLVRELTFLMAVLC